MSELIWSVGNARRNRKSTQIHANRSPIHPHFIRLSRMRAGCCLRLVWSVGFSNAHSRLKHGFPRISHGFPRIRFADGRRDTPTFEDEERKKMGVGLFYVGWFGRWVLLKKEPRMKRESLPLAQSHFPCVRAKICLSQIS